MIYGILTLVCILILCGIGIWFAIRFLKKKKDIAIKQKLEIPEEILKEFNYAEQKMKGGINEDGTTTSPHQILWEIAKNRRAESIRDFARTEQQISNEELCPEFDGGQSIQSGTTRESSENKLCIRKSKSDNLKCIISRFRRRRNTII